VGRELRLEDSRPSPAGMNCHYFYSVDVIQPTYQRALKFQTSPLDNHC
jgi:hypothetical protein